MNNKKIKRKKTKEMESLLRLGLLRAWNRRCILSIGFVRISLALYLLSLTFLRVISSLQPIDFCFVYDGLVHWNQNKGRGMCTLDLVFFLLNFKIWVDFFLFVSGPQLHPCFIKIWGRLSQIEFPLGEISRWSVCKLSDKFFLSKSFFFFCLLIGVCTYSCLLLVFSVLVHQNSWFWPLRW